MLKQLLALCAVSLSLGPVLHGDHSPAPPTIDELDGLSFVVRAKGPEYDLDGEKDKHDTTIEMTITKTGATTVSLDAIFGGMSGTASYVNGFLMQAYNTGEDPPEWGSLMQLAVTGKPGKYKLKGTLTVFDVPPGFQVLRVLKVSGKQMP